MAETARRVYYPTTGAFRPTLDMKRLADSIVSVVPVANATEAAAVVQALIAQDRAPSHANPLYVHRADATPGSELEVSVSGTTFRTVGGPRLSDPVRSVLVGPVPPVGAQLLRKMDYSTFTTNDQGDTTIHYATPFPNGVIRINATLHAGVNIATPAAVAMSVWAPNTTTPSARPTLGSFSVRVMNTDTGVGFPAGAFGLSWDVEGW